MNSDRGNAGRDYKRKRDYVRVDRGQMHPRRDCKTRKRKCRTSWRLPASRMRRYITRQRPCTPREKLGQPEDCKKKKVNLSNDSLEQHRSSLQLNRDAVQPVRRQLDSLRVCSICPCPCELRAFLWLNHPLLSGHSERSQYTNGTHHNNHD